MIFRVIALLLALTLGASAQVGQIPSWPPNKPQIGGGGCSQGTTVNARLDGSQNVSAITNLVCGLVTASITPDISYAFEINSVGNSTINLAPAGGNNATTAGGGGGISFTANSGIVFNQGGGNTVYETIAPNGGTNCTQNSCSVLVCIEADAGPFQEEWGADNSAGSSYFHFVPRNGGNTEYDLNDSTFAGSANASSIGLWIVSRTSSSAIALYHNGTSVNSASATSTTPSSFAIAIGANNNGGTLAGASLDKFGGFAIMPGLSSGQVTTVNGLFHTYFSTVNAGTGC